MLILRKLFGTDQEQIWKQMETIIGAEFIEGGFWKADKLVLKEKNWTITLDTFTQPSGESNIPYTRMRAPYVNPDGFRFKIYNKSIFSGVGKFFGMQDIEIGDPAFDEDYIIQSNNEPKIRSLLMNENIKSLFREIPKIYIEVKDDEGWFGSSFPDGVDELYFQQVGIIKNIETLKTLYLLFAEVLNQLCIIGSAYESDPGVNLK